MPSGIVTSSAVDLEAIQAFSTYLHETIHWWQHIGSTYGLMLSMAYPTQAHANYTHLRNLIANIGFKKSIRELADSLPSGGYGTPGGLANTIINNHFDMQSFLSLTLSAQSANEIVQNSLFESLGHAYSISYGNIITLLASVSDSAFCVIPNPMMWEGGFNGLRAAKEEGFYYGSPVSLYPIGAYEIFEGQARMAQLQYLHFATGGLLGMEAAEERGMFNGVYGTAFSAFLQLTKLERPSSIDHPTIGLFLLICDLALNPGSGFPFPIANFQSFIRDIDPGARFVYLCTIARFKHPEVMNAIHEYSRDEYEAISQKLCKAMIEHPPLDIAQEFSRWIELPEFLPLMSEYESFRYENGNTAVRIIFSHFLSFMRDKFEKPEFFCWPGAWMAGSRLSQDVEILFDRHGALFVDREDGDGGVYPRLRFGRSEHEVQKAFDAFYANNVIFDLTTQWIAEPGPFKFDYRWLSQNGSAAEIKEFAERTFESIYGVRPSQAIILSA
jgi:hypothetical protein